MATKIEKFIDIALAVRDEFDGDIIAVDITDSILSIRVSRRIFNQMSRHVDATNRASEVEWDGRLDSVDVDGITYTCFKRKKK